MYSRLFASELLVLALSFRCGLLCAVQHAAVPQRGRQHAQPSASFSLIAKEYLDRLAAGALQAGQSHRFIFTAAKSPSGHGARGQHCTWA